MVGIQKTKRGNTEIGKPKKLCNSSNKQGNPKMECCQCFGIVAL